MRGLALCLFFAGLSRAADVYLNPPSSLPSRLSPSHASSAISHHLGLEEFEPFQGNEQFAAGTSFVGQGPKNGLLISIDETDAKDVLPESMRPSFTLSNAPSVSSFSSIISTYLHRAPHAYAHIFSLPTYDAPLSGVISFLESDDAFYTDRFGAFELKGLSEIARAYGRASEQYQLAAETLRAAVHSALSKGDLNLVLLTYDGARAEALRKREPQQSPLPPSIPQQPINSVSTCHATEEVCRNATSACSGRGSCVSASKAGRTCFVCACSATKDSKGRTENWAGQSCERKDVSGPFVLLAGTTVALLLMIAGSVGLLYSIGGQELPTVLTGGIAGGQKRE
ncbi:hypothetical protein HETIRDRAFT_61776 [Heterobasidion irregulare TC 32-1]|uniref:Vacuolar sorting protein Vps3844 C-terminal domain-containing protein n=1 Tax=Heterobasidion irregulare (strain TC 32-1) TaxID=747525 RepID=W4K6K5_HETIT|nr:uncharacterized protein HETIRDRAFT_61776 [Heterobasidion irregulare TC 32-1]ETW80696.1 hypothetical protein HETIRDRAFT_61776 [Heterobasidion irregulare TC 32-1]